MQDESLDESWVQAHAAVELLRALGQGRKSTAQQVGVGVALEVPLAGEPGPPGEDGQGDHLPCTERRLWCWSHFRRAGVAEVVDHNVECGEEGVHHVEHEEESVPFLSGLGSKPTLRAGHLPLKSSTDNSHQAFNAEQAKTLLEAAQGERLEALYAVAVTAGLRIGELLGLRWTDVDLERDSMRVARTLSRAKNGPRFTTPKNGKGRSIVLTKQAVEALRSHRKRQNEERLRAGTLWEDNDLVFASETGTPLTQDAVDRRSFKPLLKRAELEGVRFHDLRHTCATLLLSRGVHPKFVQELLGHASIAMTLDRYSHWVPSMGDQTARAMEAILG